MRICTLKTYKVLLIISNPQPKGGDAGKNRQTEEI